MATRRLPALRGRSMLAPCLPRAALCQRTTLQVDDLIGAPDRIRTCDLCLRRAALYPAELRVPGGEIDGTPRLRNRDQPNRSRQSLSPEISASTSSRVL